ncbi:hypothetical protein [Membranihabitans marinus]|uniref:hypothetical protein n=1 Tax=Membranihabitans marinus TaxID=1227546 RepID=UPI001F411989|nr:hypothetical protein [Membranihabitans marinus]
MELQKKLIAELQKKHSRSELVKDFVDLLDISQSAAYNKVNCTSELTLSEYSKISIQYRIHTFEIGSIISADFPFLKEENRSFNDLIKLLIEDYRLYINDYGTPIIRYYSNLIPLQILINYPKIFQFTVFVWLENINSQFNTSYKQYNKIDFQDSYKEEFDNFQTLTKIYEYCDIHTFLSPNIFQTYFKLLEYHLELDTITLDQVLEIKNEMRIFLADFEKQCQDKDAKHKFYIHELNINSVMFQVQDKHTYMVMNSPIYFRVENKDFNFYIKKWFDQIESRSIPISNINEKVRRGIIKNMKNSSEKFFTKIELLNAD